MILEVFFGSLEVWVPEFPIEELCGNVPIIKNRGVEEKYGCYNGGKWGYSQESNLNFVPNATFLLVIVYIYRNFKYQCSKLFAWTHFPYL